MILSKKIKSTIIFKFFLSFLILLLFVFPKGGFKIHSIPITFGYLLLGIISLSLLIRKKYLVLHEHFSILLLLVPFQILSLITIIINGLSSADLSKGFLISFIISFIFLPVSFFLILSEYIQKIDLVFFFKIIKKGTFFVALYGIFLFFFKMFTGSFIQIPFLFMNFHDIGLLETKHIDKGTVFKLISTYNNGNLYGVCLLMFLPLYNLLENSILKKIIVKLSFLLTLSRTVWLGLIASEFFYDFFIKKNKKTAFIKFISALSIFIISMIFLAILFNFGLSWFLDPTLGGRIQQFKILFKLELFSSVKFYTINEVVYLSIMENFGILGFILFLIGILSPLSIYIIKYLKLKKLNIEKCIFFGLVTYLFTAFADGGMLLIPTMVFYWFLSSLLLTNKDSLEDKFLDLA